MGILVRIFVPVNTFFTDFRMIGIRLKEERERLGLTLVAFAKAAQAGKNTLIDWEKGKTYPTAAALAALHTIGVDITYIVTGQRLVVINEPEEQVLLNTYRELPTEAKKDILLSIMSGNIKNTQKDRSSIKVKGDKNIVHSGTVKGGIHNN